MKKPNLTTCEDPDQLGPSEGDQNDSGSPSSANANAAFNKASHVEIKNLVIMNANLSNCNVFIQSAEMAKTPLEKQSQNTVT